MEIYTEIEDLPLDDYKLDSDHDDSAHKSGIIVDPIRTLTLATTPLVKYVPFKREIKQGMIGKDCYAVKRALSKAGFGKWGG